ncbi:MAG: hypothetical protein Q8O24_00805, partial [Gallionellaceae bacterium]|nr:hypothetical protein [Gallionellaceae bacterium]
MALWEQAKKFSQAYAYPSHAFPNVDVDARCVLCQQALDDDGKARLGHFESFVVSGLEEAGKAAENLYGELINKVPALPQAKDWRLQAGVLKLDEDDADALFSTLGARSVAALTATKLEEIPAIDWAIIDGACLKVFDAQAAEVKALKELQEDGKRKQLEARVLELLAIQWLSQNKASIVDEVERLKTLGQLDKAIALTNTNLLTRKHTDLAKDELHKGYQD